MIAVPEEQLPSQQMPGAVPQAQPSFQSVRDSYTNTIARPNRHHGILNRPFTNSPNPTTKTPPIGVPPVQRPQRLVTLVGPPPGGLIWRFSAVRGN
nr:hypothetical protein FVER53263_20552 [Fusarium verticillioides]